MKSWQSVILEHIQSWESKLKSENLQWWPRYVYHVSNVTNIVSILSSGSLLSRSEMIRRGIAFHDSASSQVLSNTPASCQQFVRFYFRPRTPTFYHSEGFKPEQGIRYNAHCPIPILLIFDAYNILSNDVTMFSDGNMAKADVRYGPSQEMFRSIPFKYVFHDEAIEQHNRRIIFHRCAEVLVPQAMEIGSTLQAIYCRSLPERLTLLSLLPTDIRHKWESKISIGIIGSFFRKWVYIEEVHGVGEILIIGFNHSLIWPGPFNLTVEYSDFISKQISTFSKRFEVMPRNLQLLIPSPLRGIVTIHLDTNMAFRGEVIFS